MSSEQSHGTCCVFDEIGIFGRGQVRASKPLLITLQAWLAIKYLARPTWRVTIFLDASRTQNESAQEVPYLGAVDVYTIIDATQQLNRCCHKF